MYCTTWRKITVPTAVVLVTTAYPVKHHREEVLSFMQQIAVGTKSETNHDSPPEHDQRKISCLRRLA